MYQQVSALTLAELRADPHLTPERFISYFADFKFELGREVQKPDAFLASQCGDCKLVCHLGLKLPPGQFVDRYEG